ncbi:MAG: hypothetical protein CMJ51_04590 [Planctomycetaceae bacterium]|nr:hypothetical protein [Planctomycetaceae bacterium]
MGHAFAALRAPALFRPRTRIRSLRRSSTLATLRTAPRRSGWSRSAPSVQTRHSSRVRSSPFASTRLGQRFRRLPIEASETNHWPMV